jgi:hypothetical protein
MYQNSKISAKYAFKVNRPWYLNVPIALFSYWFHLVFFTFIIYGMYWNYEFHSKNFEFCFCSNHVFYR